MFVTKRQTVYVYRIRHDNICWFLQLFMMDGKYWFLALWFGSVISSVNGTSVSFTVQEELSGHVSLGNIQENVDKNESKLFNGTLTNVNFNVIQDGNINYASYFSINSNSDFFMVQKVDREEICQQQQSCVMTVRIFATNGTVNEFVLVTVTVLDINDNQPTFSQNALQLNIAEGTPLGTSYPLPSATDRDSGINGLQEFVLDPPDSNYELDIHPNPDGSSTLNLVLNLSLDRELWDNYQLYVKAKDGGTPSYTGTLTVNINVTDKNDNRPIFDVPEYSATIDEDAEVNSEVVTVTAKDRDIGENGRVAYYFADSATDLVRQYFGIEENSGKIFVKQRLGSTSKPFVFYVNAKDFGDPVKMDQAKVTVNIRDKNDNKPVIYTSPVTNIRVGENLRIGTHVALIIVTDADTGVNGEAECESLNTNFTIIKPVEAGVNTFSMITAVVFDTETLDTYSVEINCSDKGQPPLSSNITLTVSIEDENDHRPIFSNTIYRANVTENNNVNAVLLRVTATDRDVLDNNNLLYKIEPSLESNKFAIEASTGIIKAAYTFDREKNDSYIFQVTVEDQRPTRHTATATVIVTVLDQNDNSPQFIGDSYAMSIMENSNISKSIGTVTATDEDLGDNGRVSYMIPSEYASLPFAILDDGTIITTEVLDRETVNSYHFSVVASDHGNPPRTSRVPVYMMVLDDNDNPPIIEFPGDDNNSVSVAYNTRPNVIIASILAGDADEENNRLTYSIIGGNEEGLFGIESEQGHIFLTKTLSSGDIKQFTLTLSVKDNGKRPLEAQAKLHVRFYIANSDRIVNGSPGSGQNILIAIVISCVTFVLSVIIILIICIIKRKDSKNSLYKAKAYDEQKIMGIHRNSNRSSSSRGSQDKMLYPSEKPYMENGFVKKVKKEVSFIVEEDQNTGISMKTAGTYDPVTTFKSPSPGQSKIFEGYPAEVYLPCSEKYDGTKQREINKISSVHIHKPHAQSQNDSNNQQWQQSPKTEELGRVYVGLTKQPNMDDAHSESSEEATASDSGRGGSEEDIRSNLNSTHDADESRSPDTSAAHPFYTDSERPDFPSRRGGGVHRTGPILSSFLKQKQRRQQNEDSYKNSFPLNDLSNPRKNDLYDNTCIHLPRGGMSVDGVHGVEQVPNLPSKLDFDPVLPSSKQSNFNYRNSFENESVTGRSQDDDNTTTTSGSYTVNDIRDEILTSNARGLFYKPDTFV